MSLRTLIAQRVLGLCAAASLACGQAAPPPPPARPASARPAPPAAAPVPADVLPPLPAAASWRLVWHDEFEGADLDASKWTKREGPRRDAFWDPSDALVGDGLLRLRVHRRGERVTSGAVTSEGKFERAFGYFVARCRMPSQPGHWPAFWLMCAGAWKVRPTGRAGAEIDVVEMPWRDGLIHMAVHWGGYRSNPQSTHAEAVVSGDLRGFHTYGVHWTPDRYVFTVDGLEAWRTTGGGVSQVPEYIQLTEEVGPWAGDIAKAALPDTFEVDYVRVYETVGPAGGER